MSAREKRDQPPDESSERSPEEEGSAAKELQDNGRDADRDPEEEGSAGRPQR